MLNQPPVDVHSHPRTTTRTPSQSCPCSLLLSASATEVALTKGPLALLATHVFPVPRQHPEKFSSPLGAAPHRRARPFLSGAAQIGTASHGRSSLQVLLELSHPPLPRLCRYHQRWGVLAASGSSQEGFSESQHRRSLQE